jgi:hypothetical protein
MLEAPEATAELLLAGPLCALRDVWGRDAVRFEDRLRAAASWDERFAIT